MLFRLLAVGDVVGAPGLDFAAKNLKRIRKELGADFVAVNGENANVVGVTPKQCDALLAAGADAVTLGNHTWTRWELQPYLDESARVLRPANYAPQCPGRGAAEFRTPFGPLLLINLLGRFTLCLLYTSMEERQRAVAAFRAGGSFDPEANVQFGEGGAGAFSDGKLGTGTHDARIAFVLDSLIEHGAKPSIAYDAKPHLGTDVLSRVVVSLRREIESLGGEVRFRTRLEGLDIENLSLIHILRTPPAVTWAEAKPSVPRTGRLKRLQAPAAARSSRSVSSESALPASRPAYFTSIRPRRLWTLPVKSSETGRPGAAPARRRRCSSASPQA